MVAEIWVSVMSLFVDQLVALITLNQLSLSGAHSGCILFKKKIRKSTLTVCSSHCGEKNLNLFSELTLMCADWS